MRVLVWQWGRRGAGPLVATAMAAGLAELPGVESLLSLSSGAELLGLPGAPRNDLPMRTYMGVAGFSARLAAGPWLAHGLARRIGPLRVDVALCAMPAPLDLVMVRALRLAGVPFAVVVHDAELHPGDRFRLQMPLQRLLLRRAGALVALSRHVGALLQARRGLAGRTVVQATLPPFAFGPTPPPVGQHEGPLRLLSFGRLLPYKGLDLLADAMSLLGQRPDMVLRVVGSGPESAELARLRRLSNVMVENRWVPEAELSALLAWADALVLTHREASQSGVAAAAVAARRWVVATRVGGLAEQLDGDQMALLCAPEPAAIAAALASLPGRASPTQGTVPAWRPEAIAAALRALCGEVEVRSAPAEAPPLPSPRPG